MSKSNFDLSKIIEELAESLEPLATAKEQKLSAKIVEGIETIGDKQKVTQVISNLIENAVKYSPHEAKITVGITRRKDEAVVSIKDTGYGIAKDDQEQIFEAFFRSRTDENWEVPGTGLALVKRIVSMHGGTVSVDSEVRHGSKFTVVLPIITTNSNGDSTESLTEVDKAGARILTRRREIAALAKSDSAA